ncbi:glycoside hydrolase family 16 protein [Microbispora siamensis]
MAAAMLIAAATACSNGDSTKVFNAGGESTAQGSASSPGSSGALPGNANAAGLSATQTATAAAAPAGENAGQKGDEAAEKTGDTTVAEKIGDVPAGPSPRPSPSLSPLPSPGLSSRPPATPAPTAETEPPMRLARPVRTADRPVVVDVIEPEDVPRADRAPAGATPGGTNGAARQSSPPSRTPPPRSSGASAGGWGDPALTEDFGGQALRVTAGSTGVDLSGSSVQRYGRWEVRLRAEEGALPVALLRSARSAAAQYGDSRRDDSRYDESRYDESRYDDSWRDDSEYTGPQDDVPRSARSTETEDASISVAGIAGGRRAELSVRQDRELARAETAADFTQWHTIAVDWLPGRVTFWLDGRQVWNYTGPYVPRSPLGLVLRNDASGGTVYVDWVRIYRAPER